MPHGLGEKLRCRSPGGCASQQLRANVIHENAVKVSKLVAADSLIGEQCASDVAHRVLQQINKVFFAQFAGRGCGPSVLWRINDLREIALE